MRPRRSRAADLDRAAFAKLRDLAGRKAERAQDLVGVLAEKRRRAAVRDGCFGKAQRTRHRRRMAERREGLNMGTLVDAVFTIEADRYAGGWQLVLEDFRPASAIPTSAAGVAAR